MHHALSRRLALAVLLAPFAACGNANAPVDLGHDGPSHALGSALSDYAGTWQGHAEAFEFEDETDGVRLELRADGSGELRLGDSPLLPPPDPNRGFPPSERGVVAPAAGPEAIPGFLFPISDAKVSDSRIQIGSSGGEIYREWCELMTPNLVGDATPTHYACLPTDWGPSDPSECVDPEIAIDCNVRTCTAACECTQEECHVRDDLLQPDIQIDARLEDDGDSFVGTLVLGSERVTVLLTRM